MSDQMIRPVCYGMRRADGAMWNEDAYQRGSETTTDGRVFGCVNYEELASAVICQSEPDMPDPGEAIPVKWSWDKQDYVDMSPTEFYGVALVSRNIQFVREWIENNEPKAVNA